MELPAASQTRNFTGSVLPPLRGKTLVPSLLIGCRITPPGPTAGLYTPYPIAKVVEPLLELWFGSPAVVAEAVAVTGLMLSEQVTGDTATSRPPAPVALAEHGGVTADPV
jgi:hypothetical protein